LDTLELLILALLTIPIIMILIEGITMIVAHLRSVWPTSTLWYRLCVYAVSIILITSAVGGVAIFSSDNNHNKGSSFVVPANSGPNLLKNPSFETGLGGLADDWEREYDHDAVLSLVNIGVVEGNSAQHFSKTGKAEDNNGVLELFQAIYSNNTYGPGDVLIFSVYASGSVSKCSAMIGIEGFKNNKEFIDEKDVYISGLTGSPQIYGVTYQVPLNCYVVAAFLQFNEINSYSSLSISIDNASLVRVPAS
jgi:hypothetical protein